jgi:hypothetical protein
LREIAGAQGVAIAHRTPKGRKITVRDHRFCQDASGARQELRRLHRPRMYFTGVPLNDMSCIFKT